MVNEVQAEVQFLVDSGIWISKALHSEILAMEHLPFAQCKECHFYTFKYVEGA